MTLSQSLTNLGDAVREEKLLSDKLTIDEMADVLSSKNDLKDELSTKLFIEALSITENSDGYVLKNVANKGLSRTALNFNSINLVGRTIRVYFQAFANSSDVVPINVTQSGGPQNRVNIKKGPMRGYFLTFKLYNTASLSIYLLDKNSSITIKDLRAWFIS